MNDLEQRLSRDFHDREYREAYAESFLNSWIAHQLTAVRRQRGLTQQQLAELIGTKQSGISRMEKEDYGKWNFVTLQRIAFALDCRLKVSLEDYGSLVKEAANFSEMELWRPTFADDPFFHPGLYWQPELADPSPLGEMRRKLLPWLFEHGHLEKLADWLQGYDLPFAGDALSPAQWILQALPPNEDIRVAFSLRVRNAIDRRWDVQPPGKRAVDLVENLLTVIEGLRRPKELGDSVSDILAHRASLPLADAASPGPGHVLVRAVMNNQPDERFRPFWKSEFLRERDLAVLSDYVTQGLIGLAYIGLEPNVNEIADGAKEARRWRFRMPQIIETLSTAFTRVWSVFQWDKELKLRVIRRALSAEWPEPVLVAWNESKGAFPPSFRDGYEINAVSLAQNSGYKVMGAAGG